jgi:hypothetical protein
VRDATEASDAPEPSLKDLQSHGYAEVYARNNEEHFKHDPFVYVPPTIEEMETAYSSASRDDNGDLCVRGVRHEVDLATSDLRYKATVFRPDPDGQWFYVEPVYEDGRIIDVIWSTIDLDDWGFTTGRGAVFGAENLMKTYTAELPLHVYNDPHSYWEHFQESEDGSDKEDAVCILKQSARALLPAVGHVQMFYWDDVRDLAEEFFPDHPERISAFQDQEAFDAFVKRAALWESFDHMQAATPPTGARLTWAHAKNAVKARRKTNAETGLDGFEEIRARVKAHAAQSEVRVAVDAWHEHPSDVNKLLAQRACMPFHLRDIVFARMTGPFVSFDEWERRQAESVAVPEEAPKPKPATKRAAKRLPSALDGVTVGRNTDWTAVSGPLAEMRDYVLATAPYPNRPLATAAALVTLSAVSGGRVYTPTGLNLSLYLALLAETGEGKDAPLKAPGKFLHAAGLDYMAQPGKSFTVSGFEQCLIDSHGSCVATCDEIGENLLAKILSKRAMSSEAAIKHFLMELSGVEDVSPPFALTKRAANGVDRKKLQLVQSIPSASFSLFGASTHARFYEALSQGNVDDGSLNRFLIISADAPPDAENIVEERVPVPQSIVGALKVISDANRVGGFKFNEDANVWPSFESERAGWGDGARELYKLLGEQLRTIVRSEAPFKGLYARVKANALKVATLLALSRAVGGEDLAVTVADIEMGAAMALESATTTVDGAMKHMAGSEFEENCKTVLRRMEAADEKGISAAVLHRTPGVSKIEPRKFKDVCDYLGRTGQVEVREHSKKKGQFRYFPLAGRAAFEEEE